MALGKTKINKMLLNTHKQIKCSAGDLAEHFDFMK